MSSITPSRMLSIVNDPKNLPERDRVAFATSDRIRVDEHFGTAVCFLVYRFDDTQWQLTHAIEYPTLTKGHDANKLASRVLILQGCSHVYCTAIGHSAIQQLLQHKIQPLIVEPQPIEPILMQRLQFIQRQEFDRTREPSQPDRLIELLNDPWQNNFN